MTLADRRPLTNAYEPPLPAVRRRSICGAGLGFGPQSSQTGSESTVRNHVRERKHQMGLLRRETFVPQSYGWAQEAQVDWYEAWADLGDERTKVQVFAMRSMASGAAFHRAYRHATQQAFLEAHEHAFAY